MSEEEKTVIAPEWINGQQQIAIDAAPKAKRTRRTKAQMLADAAARPNADRTITAPSLLVTQAIETSRANADEIASFAPRRGNGASRLPIIAVAMSILALAVSIINAAH